MLRDIIEEYTEEIKLAGGIGCFEKGMPLQSMSSIGNDQKESDFGYNTASSTLSDASPRFYNQWKGENRADTEYPMEIRTKTDKGKRHDSHSGSAQRQQSYRSHRSYKHNDRRDDEFTRTERRSVERKSYHQHHKSSHGKSSSDYNTKKDEPYERRSRGSRNQNSFEDRYNPLEKE